MCGWYTLLDEGGARLEAQFVEVAREKFAVTVAQTGEQRNGFECLSS